MIINLTPHEINILNESGDLEISPDGTMERMCSVTRISEYRPRGYFSELRSDNFIVGKPYKQ